MDEAFPIGWGPRQYQATVETERDTQKSSIPAIPQPSTSTSGTYYKDEEQMEPLDLSMTSRQFREADPAQNPNNVLRERNSTVVSGSFNPQQGTSGLANGLFPYHPSLLNSHFNTPFLRHYPTLSPQQNYSYVTPSHGLGTLSLSQPAMASSFLNVPSTWKLNKDAVERSVQAPTKEPRGEKKPRPHVCDEPDCGSAFAKHSQLKRHKLTHTGEKPWCCTWKGCGKRFSRSDMARRHYRCHTKEKTHKCDFCHKEFLRADHKRQHMKTHKKGKKSNIVVRGSSDPAPGMKRL